MQKKKIIKTSRAGKVRPGLVKSIVIRNIIFFFEGRGVPSNNSQVGQNSCTFCSVYHFRFKF